MIRRLLSKFLLVLFFGWFLLATASAHNPDTSYARVRVLPERLELRLTFDVITLQMIVPDLDANRDRALSRAELAAAIGKAREFLTGHVFLQIDDRDVPLVTPGEPFWPLDASDPLPEEKWHEVSALISFPFDTKLAARPKSVGLGFSVFDQLGNKHTILTNFEAGGPPKPVVFNIAEPDDRFEVPALPAPTPMPGPSTPSPIIAPHSGGKLKAGFLSVVAVSLALLLVWMTARWRHPR